MNILDAMNDPNLLGTHFRGPSWSAWRAFLSALFGLPLDRSSLRLYRHHTGRDTPPQDPFSEGYVVVGRRGGKSRMAALVSVYLACFREYRDLLAPGEQGVVMALAQDRRQARVTFKYIEGIIDASPLLAAMVVYRAPRSPSS